VFTWSSLFGSKPRRSAGGHSSEVPTSTTVRSADVRIELEQSRTFSYGLAGPTHHEAALRHFYGRGELDATIEQDKANPVDPNAVKVTVAGRLIGYFHAEHCEGFISWVRWRGYDGRAFKAPAIVERDGILKAKLRILLNPPRVMGDLDRSTKKAVDMLLRQTRPLCVKHMQREAREAGERTLAGLEDTGLVERKPCSECGGKGFVGTERAWLAKFGQQKAYVAQHPDHPAVSGWVE
jgi:hypothetical protein